MVFSDHRNAYQSIASRHLVYMANQFQVLYFHYLIEPFAFLVYVFVVLVNNSFFVF